MANLSNNVKTAFLKGLEALGKTASSLSDAASQKLTEMNLDTRRREVLSQIPKCVMQLWKDGVELPEPLTALLNELTDVENQLAALRPRQEAPAPEKEPEDEQPEDVTEIAEEVSEEVVAEEVCEIAEEPAEEDVQIEEDVCECPSEELEKAPGCAPAEAAEEIEIE